MSDYWFGDLGTPGTPSRGCPIRLIFCRPQGTRIGGMLWKFHQNRSSRKKVMKVWNLLDLTFRKFFFSSVSDRHFAPLYLLIGRTDLNNFFFCHNSLSRRSSKINENFLGPPNFSLPLESEAGLSRKTGVFYRNTWVCLTHRSSLPLMPTADRFILLNLHIYKEHLVSATFFSPTTRSAAMATQRCLFVQIRHVRWPQGVAPTVIYITAAHWLKFLYICR